MFNVLKCRHRVHAAENSRSEDKQEVTAPGESKGPTAAHTVSWPSEKKWFIWLTVADSHSEMTCNLCYLKLPVSKKSWPINKCTGKPRSTSITEHCSQPH